MTKIVRSKYGFSSLGIGDRFFIKPIELGSMRSSLSIYNKKNGIKIEVSVNEISNSKLEIERVK